MNSNFQYCFFLFFLRKKTASTSLSSHSLLFAFPTVYLEPSSDPTVPNVIPCQNAIERRVKRTYELQQVTDLPLLLQSRLLLGVLQRRADRLLQRPLVLLLLLLQSRLDVDLLSDPLLSQFRVQLVDATVRVGDQGVEVVRRQLAS